MPTYDYKCLECGYQFEEFQSIKAEPLTVCPECKGHVKRLIGAGSGPIFKGSGFYHTDYKMSNSSNNKSSNTAKPTAKSDSSSSSKKD